MSRLSGLLKRQFPAHRQRIGSIRKWVERSEVMSITKQGSWIISLNEGRPRKGAVEEGPRQTVFYGVEDWIYFRPGHSNMMGIDLLHRARRQLRGVLSRRLKGEGTPSLWTCVSECLAALPVEASLAEITRKEQTSISVHKLISLSLSLSLPLPPPHTHNKPTNCTFKYSRPYSSSPPQCLF